MDASSVVSSLSASVEFLHSKPVMVHHTTTNAKSWGDTGGGGNGGGNGGRRPSYDLCGRSEISTGTGLSAERPCTRDTNTLFMRDASILSGQPDKSNFREKMQNWMVYDEEVGSNYVAPRPTTSFASQKPGIRGAIMEDIEREMSFLMSRPATGFAVFPSKPKELVEPLEGFLPEERLVSQKKFIVLPSIGGCSGRNSNSSSRNDHFNNSQGEQFFLRRQRSNIETTNQLDYSRSKLEREANFFTDYYNYYHYDNNDNNDDEEDYSGGGGERRSRGRNPRESPSKGGAGKTATPMPLPPIAHHLQWEKRPARAGLVSLAGLEEEFSRDHSQLTSNWSAEENDEEEEQEEEEDPDCYRIKTPDSYNFSRSPPTSRPPSFPIPPPPPAFR